MRRAIVIAAALALLVPALTATAQQKNLTWTAGQVGGGWYSQAGGVVEVIKAEDPPVHIKGVPGAGLQNKFKLPHGQTQNALGVPPLHSGPVQRPDPDQGQHPDKHGV